MATTWNVGYNAAGSALDFTTIATALASASVVNGDTLDLWYSDAGLNLAWAPGSTSVTKDITIKGHFPGRLVLVFAAGDLFSTNAAATFYNLSMNCGQVGGTECINISGNGAVVDSCEFRSNRVGIQVNTGAVCTVKNCTFYDSIVGVQVVAGSCTMLKNEAVRCLAAGFQRTGGTAVAKNNVAMWCGDGFLGTGWDAASTNNASTDATCPGSSPSNNIDPSAVKPWMLDSNYYYPIDCRSTYGSSLIGAGADDGITVDMDGRPNNGTHPIGPSIGIYLPTTDVSKILTTATPAGTWEDVDAAAVLTSEQWGVGGTSRTGTFDVAAYEASRNSGTAAGNILVGNSIKIANVTTNGTFDEAARNTDPGVANVKVGEAYKIQGADLVGTYNPLPTAAVEPDITGVVPGDESLTVTVVPSTGNELVPIYVRFFLAPGGALSAENPTFSRTGTGDITITGLTNGAVYGVLAYHLGTCPGYASAPEYGMPDSDITDSSTISEVADAVKTEIEGISYSIALDHLERAWLPRKKMNSFAEGETYVTVCPRRSEPVQLSRSKVMKEYQIDVVVQVKVDNSGNTDIDPLVRLSDQIAKSLRNIPLAGAPDVRWVREQREPIFSDDTAEQFSVFTSVISLFYRFDE